MTRHHFDTPSACPVPSPRHLKKLKSRKIPAGSEWLNVTTAKHAEDVFNASGHGLGRFSPLFGVAGTPVPVLYVARHPVAALLETVFHNVWGGEARHVGRTALDGRILRRIRFETDVRVVDLHDDQLIRHQLTRDQMVATSAEHYECTAEWADQLLGVSVGGQPTAGLGWQSRMIELAAQASTRMIGSMLEGEQTEVAALYKLPDGLRDDDMRLVEVEELDSGFGYDLVLEVANTFGIVIDPA